MKEDGLTKSGDKPKFDKIRRWNESSDGGVFCTKK